MKMLKQMRRKGGEKSRPMTERASTVLVFATDSNGMDGGIAAVGVDGDLVCERSKGVGRRKSSRDIEQGLRIGDVK